MQYLDKQNYRISGNSSNMFKFTNCLSSLLTQELKMTLFFFSFSDTETSSISRYQAIKSNIFNSITSLHRDVYRNKYSYCSDVNFILLYLYKQRWNISGSISL